MAAIYSSWNHSLPQVKICIGQNVGRFVEDVSSLPEFKAAYSAERVEFTPPNITLATS
jgi:hypothetical protein